MLNLIFILVFITLLLLIYSILAFFTYKKKAASRLYKYINVEKEPDIPHEKRDLKSTLKGLLSSGKSLGNLSIFNSYKKNIQGQLNKARIPLKGEEFITICILCSIVFVTLFSLITRSFIIGIVFGVFGWFLPLLFVKARKKKRIKLLNEQLGDAIAMISNSLKAGYSFFQAIDTVSTEMSGSIAEEFAQVKKEINLGLTTENALENLVKRMESDDLELVVTAIMIQRQVGGNLAEILDNISETIRERVRMKGEVRAITAQGRMSGIIISVLPPAIGVFMVFVNPKYIGLLFTSKLGLIMVAVSVVMELIGIFCINKIVKVEF